MRMILLVFMLKRYRLLKYGLMVVISYYKFYKLINQKLSTNSGQNRINSPILSCKQFPNLTPISSPSSGPGKPHIIHNKPQPGVRCCWWWLKTMSRLSAVPFSWFCQITIAQKITQLLASCFGPQKGRAEKTFGCCNLPAECRSGDLTWISSSDLK